MRRAIWQALRESVLNIYKNKYRYIVTSIFLQVFLMTVGRSLLYVLFQGALTASGYDSLTKDNILGIIGQTGPFLLLIVYILVLASLIFMELICLIFMVARTYRHFEFRDLIYSAWRKILWLSGPQFLIFFFYLMTMVPLRNLGLSSPLLATLRIPDFIIGELEKTTLGTGVYYLFLGLIAYLNLRLLYFLPLAVVNHSSPWKNIKQSFLLTRNTILKLLLSIGIMWGLSVILGLGILYILSLVFSFIDNFIDNLVVQTVFYSLARSLFYLFVFFEKLMLIELLVNHLLTEDKQQPEEELVTLTDSPAKPFRYPKWSKAFVWLTVIAALIYNGSRIYLTTFNPKIELVAHRGDVSAGVENSLEALEAANQKQADLVETDLLMTADQELVVIHDNHLQRLAGKNWQVSDKNLADLEGVKIQQDGFTGEIVSLETFLARAEELNQALMLELKPHGDEPDNYVDLVIAEFKRLNLDKKHKIMSLNLPVMEELEKKAPEFETGYVIPLQFGGFEKPAIDFFVIEDFSYNEWQLFGLEQTKKPIYVWTINDESKMVHYLHSPITGIITDELDLFKKKEAELKKEDSYFSKALYLIDVRPW